MTAPANADVGSTLYRIMRSLEHCDAEQLTKLERFINGPPQSVVNYLHQISNLHREEWWKAHDMAQAALASIFNASKP